MSHFSGKITSPFKVMSVAYFYVAIISISLYTSGFYQNSSFFAWGPPIKFFGQDITTNSEFYFIIVLIFFHQIVNNCVNSVVYPWIINSVQDPKNKNMEYSNATTLLILNLFDIYSQLDVIFIVMGFMSQISFVCVVSFSNLITSTYINYQYLLEKKRITNEVSPLLSVLDG